MKVSIKSYHPAAVAYRNNMLESYNKYTFGEHLSDLYFRPVDNMLIQEKKISGFKFYYSKKFSYIRSTTVNNVPKYINCMEFVQRLHDILGNHNIEFYALYVFPMYVSYLPFLKKYEAPSRTMEELKSACQYYTVKEIHSILRQTNLEIHVIRVWVKEDFIPIRGPHFCVIIGKNGKYLSAAVGDIHRSKSKTQWSDIFVSIPDPLVIREFNHSYVISSSITANASKLIEMFRLYV